MVGKRLEKLTEWFVGPYKVKGIVSTNAIELELPSSIKIHLVVNISQVQLYRPQMKEQRKTPPKPVIIEGEEEFEIEKILNKRIVRGKKKFLVQQKGYIAEGDTWKSRENLKNMKELVEEFEREYGKEAKEVRQQKKEDNKKKFSRELPGKFIAKILQGWSDKKYKRQREKRQEKNQRQWKNSLGQGNLKGRLYYEMTPKKKTISYIFINLMENTQEYNIEKI